MRNRLGQRSRKPLSLAIALASGWVAMAAPLAGQQQQAQPKPQPQMEAEKREHVVRRGDTLWDLAAAYLKNPFLWPAIFEVNRQVVENPHWIFPKERLVIPPVPPAATDSGVAQSEPMAPTVLEDTLRTRFYRVAEKPVPVDTAQATVLETVQAEPAWVVSPHEYASTPFLADSAELGVFGRVIELGDPSQQNEVFPPAIRPYDVVFLGRLQGTRPAEGDTVSLVRFGRNVEGVGRVVEPVALLRVDSVGLTVITARVVRQFSMARVGDAVMPREPLPPTVRGVASPVSEGAQGRLIGFVEPEPIHATTDRGFVNIGRARGVAMGDELIAFIPERGTDDNSRDRLPPTAIATLRVVKVRENSATVRVIGTRYAVLNAGMPVVIVRKIQ